MKRKVVQHGLSTLIISLPSDWVKEHNIKKGDELEVKEDRNSLLINAGEIRKSIGITQDVSGLLPRLVDRFLARSYQKGYDRILLTHNDLKLLEVMQKKTPELIGYEIMEQNNHSCTIQSISSKIELDFDNSLRKAFLIIKQMLSECYEAYKKGDKNTLNNLYLKDFEVNRLCYFCLRQINKKHYIGPEFTQQTHILYYLIEILEDLGDNYKKLAKQLVEIKKKNNDIIKILELMLKQFELSYSFFYKATKEGANKAFLLHKEIGAMVEDVAGKKPTKEEILSLILIKDAAHIVYHFTTMRLDYLKIDSQK